MLDVRKLVAAALLCLLWFSGAAHALIPASPLWVYDDDVSVPQQKFADINGACGRAVQQFTTQATPYATLLSVTLASPTNGTCTINVKAQPEYNGTDQVVAVHSVPGSCPTNSTAVSGGCQCSTGFVQNAAGTACEVAPPTCTAGTPVSGGYFDAGPSITKGPPAVVCKGGCSIFFDGTFPAGSAIVGGVKHYFAQGTYSNLGSTCSANVTDGSGTSVSSLPADSCAAGQQMGEVNGEKRCADAPGSDGKGTETPTDAPSTSTGTKTESTVTNGDGSTTKTVTETLTAANGTKTTTTTVTNTSGDGKTVTGSTTTVKTPAPGTGPSGGVGQEGETPEKTECERNSSAKGCGGVPSDPNGSAFYTKKEKTVASIFEGAKTALQASPVGGAVGGFFSVSAGGSCTPSSGTIAYFNRSYSFDAMCSQMAMNLYLLMKGVLLLLATWWAFRIAIE